MEFLSEDYKTRLQHLAGLMEAISSSEKEILYKDSAQRIPFDRALMKQAIERGMEVGLSFQSNNEKYKMPVTKYRIIQPVAMGTSTAGELVIRGVHIVGQSERAARETGSRSAEVENEWRLFKAKNIKGMWLTGRYFSEPIPGYNANDSDMSSIEVAYNPMKARSYQDGISKEKAYKEREKELQQQNKVRPLFRKPNERPGLGPKINPDPNKKGPGSNQDPQS